MPDQQIRSAQISSDRRRQQGFTLVEIGVVLVVIGLLLAAVLKGKELIATAQLNGLIQKMNGYKAAINGFEDRYRIVPGDSSKASILLGADAKNCSSSLCNDRFINLANEILLVSNHLSVAGFYSGPAELPIDLNTQPIPNKTHMSNPKGGAITYRSTYYVADFYASNAGGYKGGAPGGTGVLTGGNLSSKFLAELDRKIDDGNGKSGNVRHTWGSTSTGGFVGCIDIKGNWIVKTPASNCGAIDMLRFGS